MMRRGLVVVMLAFCCLAVGDGWAAKRMTLKGWVRKGPLGPTPKRVTADYPLSDQGNTAGWVKFEPLWDEFEADALDRSKWYDHNPRWLGRQPAFFSPENVTVRDGQLHLTMRKDTPTEALRKRGYHTYSSAAVQSKVRVLYGYFEIKARPMKSAGSSAFWFYDRTPAVWTEIDVFELGGGAPGFEKRFNTNLHVFRTPEVKEHLSYHEHWMATKPLADDYHVYGLEWDRERITWYVDGVPVRWVENRYWHQPLTLNFDSETMPNWLGLPRDEDLPSTYSIAYVRAWKQRTAQGEGDCRPSEPAQRKSGSSSSAAAGMGSEGSRRSEDRS